MILPHRHIHILLSTAVFLLPLSSRAQQTSRVVSGCVIDSLSREPISDAIVRIADGGGRLVFTNTEGHFMIAGHEGADAEVLFIGYESRMVKLHRDGTYALMPIENMVADVVVTATESSTLTTTSKIERRAIEHLQPSSLTDVMELLPGGQSADPELSRPNVIRLREAGLSNEDYATSSLGTALIIDGAPVSTNANMQNIDPLGVDDNKVRDHTNQGVDMRSISTDDIESVEVVRGIASAEYGELTSGIIKIRRRQGGQDLRARFKADMDTKMLYVAKDMEWNNGATTLNISADYLNNRADPRNLLETFKRASISVRVGHTDTVGSFNSTKTLAVDYRGSFDNDKSDPEVTYGGENRFSSDYNRWSANCSYNLSAAADKNGLRRLWVDIALSAERNISRRIRLVQLDRETPAAVTREEGESDAVIITPYTYTATHTVEGMPTSCYAKMGAEWRWMPTSAFLTSLRAGGDWQMDKNYGGGQVFDELQPLYPGLSTRPRSYNEIPTSRIGGLYGESLLEIGTGAWRFDIQMGLRLTSRFNLSREFALRGKVYADPRLSAAFTLPTAMIGDSPLLVRLMLGIGEHTKMPTLGQLYPDKAYMDIVELNYYHTQKEFRRIYLQTYIADQTNYDLRAARNIKRETSADIRWNGNRLNITFFKEVMTSGFRDVTVYAPYTFKRFDVSGVDADALTAAPDISTLPYTDATDMRAYHTTINGSTTDKKGLELTFSSHRIKTIDTRLTVTGAWFKTEYHNSQEVMERPTNVVDGQRVNVVGIYKDDTGFLRETANTNFTFDTNLQRINMGLSLSAQCTWYTAARNMRKSEYPDRYMDSEGVIHPYDEPCRDDIVLRHLIRRYSSTLEERQTVPFCMNVNLKATKRLIDNRLMVALFANKVWDVNPEYVRNGFTIRRYVRPYFGVELNMKL